MIRIRPGRRVRRNRPADKGFEAVDWHLNLNPLWRGRFMTPPEGCKQNESFVQCSNKTSQNLANNTRDLASSNSAQGSPGCIGCCHGTIGNPVYCLEIRIHEDGCFYTQCPAAFSAVIKNGDNSLT